MSIESDSHGDNISIFDLEDQSIDSHGDTISLFASEDESNYIDHVDEVDERSIPQNEASGESSNSSNDSTCVYHHSVAPHDVTPDVPEEFKPNEFMSFKRHEDAVEFYKMYAQKAGFDGRLNTTRKEGGILIHRYVICHRYGSAPERSVQDRRKTKFKVTMCQAKIVIKRDKLTGEYKFEKFFEDHNHPLMDSEDLRSSRQLSYSTKEFIVRASTVKLGATKAFKLKAALNGGYEFVNAKVTDYKNFKRNMGSSICFGDGQIIVNKMTERKANYPNFSFSYKCDEENVLKSLFWADATDKAYYSEFGDVVSFDATFRTNKYSLVFVPFTVIDNHRSSVTVGAGLLSTESIESYKWLLEEFLNAHGGKHPVFALTDQDPALKQAVEVVFPNSNHRLCMWHITKKLRSKLSVEFLKTTNFKEEFDSLVWKLRIEPDVFESRWDLLMKKYKLEDNKWFSDIFDIRHNWIPAYFKELPFCGLMKTTSRSESMNSFFNSYSQSENFLVNFMNNYDTAIRKQRYTQRENDKSTTHAHYVLKTPLSMEIHASETFTSIIFFGIQREMHNAEWFCEEKDCIEVDGLESYTIIHKDKNREFKTEYKVELKLPERDITCSCEYFNRFGVLCRHAFRVLMKKNFHQIPDKYILGRWKKDIISSKYDIGNDRYGDIDVEVAKLVHEGYSGFESGIDLVRGDKEKLSCFVEKIQSLVRDLKNDSSVDALPKQTEKEVIEELLSVSIPEEVVIQPPGVQNNKGCGKKRMVGALEQAIEETQRKTRKCSVCNKREPHNSRTCPEKENVEKGKKKPGRKNPGRKNPGKKGV